MSAFVIAEALGKAYASPRYATAYEVRNATGFKANRACDVLSLSLWPSDGMHLMGFEIKVSRSDWARELDNPQKANDIAKYCDYWSLACPPDVCPTDDPRLPEAWGLYHWADKKLRRVKPPKQREPIPLDRSFVAAVLRANLSIMDHMVMRDSIAAEVEAAREAGRKSAQESADHATRQLRDNYAALQRRVVQFENAAGVRLGEWHDTPEQIGRAVRWIADGGIERERERLAQFADRAEAAAAMIRGLLVTQIDDT